VFGKPGPTAFLRSSPYIINSQKNGERKIERRGYEVFSAD